MMVKEEYIGYTGYKCDGCEREFEDFDGSNLFENKSDMFKSMKDEGWRNIDNKWYCPECIKTNK